MARSKTTFVKGDKRAGRKPKATEVSELQRLIAFAKGRGLQDKILAKIADLADAGEQWAIEWWACRFFPEAHVAQKINADTGATDAGSDLAAALRAVAEQLRPVAVDA